MTYDQYLAQYTDRHANNLEYAIREHIASNNSRLADGDSESASYLLSGYNSLLLVLNDTSRNAIDRDETVYILNNLIYSTDIAKYSTLVVWVTLLLMQPHQGGAAETEECLADVFVLLVEKTIHVITLESLIDLAMGCGILFAEFFVKSVPDKRLSLFNSLFATSILLACARRCAESLNLLEWTLGWDLYGHASVVRSIACRVDDEELSNRNESLIAAMNNILLDKLQA